MTHHIPNRSRPRSDGQERPRPGWILLAFALIGLAAGCAGVAPYQRAVFGTYTMRADRDPLDSSFREHIYFTREAATGGTGVGGGGCGCN